MKQQPNFAHNIRLIRELMGLTRKELGDKINLSEDVIYTYEKRNTSPKELTISRMADVFKIPVPELVNEKLTEKKVKWIWGSEKEKPEEANLNEPDAVYKNASQLYADLINQQNQLISSLNKQSETSNRILQLIAENLEIKVEAINTNLNDALSRVHSLKFDLYSGRQVVLESLARLEGKNEKALLKQADSIVLSLMDLQKKQSKI